jgi:hypothetical protein
VSRCVDAVCAKSRGVLRAFVGTSPIKVERSVRTVLEWHPVADGEPVQAVSDLKAVLVFCCVVLR